MDEIKTSVCGIYATHADLEAGIQSLKRAGFRSADISVICGGNCGDATSVPVGSVGGYKEQEVAYEGAATGATSGAVLGGALGWLAGIGSLSIPGLGPLVAAGPVMAALAGAGAGGAVGGIAGGLIGLGVPETAAQGYQGHLQEGRTLLCVHPLNPYWTKRARELLESTGAQHLSST